MSLRFTLDGDVIAPPQNWKELEIEMNFDNNGARLTATDFEFLGSTAKFINDWIEDGCNGGVGLLEPPVFKVDEVCEEGVFNILDSILKLDEAEFACDWTKTPIQELGNLDFMENVADSFSFAYLTEGLDFGDAGKIEPNQFSEIYYNTLDVPDVPLLINLSLSLYGLVFDIIQTIDQGVEAIAAFIGNYPAIFEGIGDFIINGLQTAILTLQAKVLVQQIVDALIPFPRKHKALKVKTAFEKSCEYLGYNFSSTILDSEEFRGLCILPKKTTQGSDINALGGLGVGEGYPEQTFGDFIREINDVFNAKITIIGDTLHWERWDYFKEQSTYQAPNVKKEFNGTNASELNYNFILEFQTDSADLQTFQQFDNGIYSHTVIPIVTNVGTATTNFQNSANKKRLLTKGLDNRQFGYGLVGRRSTCSTPIEQVVTILYEISQGVPFLIEKITSQLTPTVSILGQEYDLGEYASYPEGFVEDFQFTCRKGFMLLATDYVGQKRLCILDSENENLISSNNEIYLTSEYLFNNFHYINSPAPFGDNTQGNQWTTYKNIEVPFTCKDFQEIKQQGHNYIKFNDKGVIRDAKIENLKFNPYDCTANMSVRIQKKFTCNLTSKERAPEPALIRDSFTTLLESFSEVLPFLDSDNLVPFFQALPTGQ
jgi:hypothetical protein